jgi:hypothetical protein
VLAGRFLTATIWHWMGATAQKDEFLFPLFYYQIGLIRLIGLISLIIFTAV